MPRKKLEPKCQRVSILHNPDGSGALDWVSIPDRGDTCVIGTVTRALGHDSSSVTLLRSSITRSRCRNREKQAIVQQEFIHNTPLLHCTLGRCFLTLLRAKTVDKIAVLVTGGREEMLLGVPKIGHGTGKQQAEACLTTLDECGIRQQICGLVFDTTASNTGLKYLYFHRAFA